MSFSVVSLSHRTPLIDQKDESACKWGELQFQHSWLLSSTYSANFPRSPASISYLASNHWSTTLYDMAGRELPSHFRTLSRFSDRREKVVIMCETMITLRLYTTKYRTLSLEFTHDLTQSSSDRAWNIMSEMPASNVSKIALMTPVLPILCNFAELTAGQIIWWGQYKWLQRRRHEAICSRHFRILISLIISEIR